ncbi:hypothetical protein AOLI_G00328630 [Acnodon oligacanthus]
METDQRTPKVTPAQRVTQRGIHCPTGPLRQIPECGTPEVANRKLHSPVERSATLPARIRGSSAPSSFLQEKMEELQLHKDKRREPD